MSVVFHQPATPSEWQATREALASCPTESIGADGSMALTERRAAGGDEPGA